MAGGNLKNKMRFWKPKPVKQAMADVFAGYNSKETARTSAAKQMWAIKRMEYDMMTEAQREALAAQRQDNADAFASALAGVFGLANRKCLHELLRRDGLPDVQEARARDCAGHD